MNDLSKLSTLTRSLLRGVGQVMFQDSAWTGLLILAGIFWGSFAGGTPQVAWGALVGLIASTLSGMLMGIDSEDGQNGLWGFNGILVGCAFPTFFDDTWLMWVALIICAMTTTWVRKGFNNVMAPWKVNSLTFPFVFMTWLFLLCAKTLHGLPEYGLSVPTLESSFSDAVATPDFQDIIEYWLKGVSQVFLVNSWVTGLLFLIGLALCSRWAALWAGIGSAIALALAFLFGADSTSISAGLYGFSPVLTGIALGMTFYKPNWKSALWALAGIIVTFFIQAGMNSLMEPFGIPTLTGPFCITTWLFLLPLYKMDVEEKPDHSSWSKK
ncbi:MAG: urea transporter [Bacteroidales bacterium]|nr:urea transporter [Bacteroidales bacterium]